MKKLFFIIFFVTGLIFASPSQTVTNEGTDFWIAIQPNAIVAPVTTIFISSVFATSGSVSSAFPGVNQNFTVVPGVITQIPLPPAVKLQGGVEDKGIHITSNDPVSVYGLTYFNGSTGAFMALPVNALASDYRVMAYTNSASTYNTHLSVVATADNTVLTIFNKWTNTTENITLNTGQTFMNTEPAVFGKDITGSRIQSTFPVAVFGSNDCTTVPGVTCQACDQVVEQMFPYYSWGKNFITVPLAGRDGSGDVFRILSSDDANGIFINGIAAGTINAGEHYETEMSGFNAITTTKASLVAQFAKGQQCAGGTIGDPLMMLLLPREQFLTNYTICTIEGFASNWVNVVAPSYAVGTILLDGVTIPAAVFTQVGATSWFGAQLAVSSGSHTFTSTYPFGLFSYGWNDHNAYGYPGGGSMSPVGTVNSISISPATASGILNETTICFTAHVEDLFSNPVAGVLVNFNISGISNITGNAYTNASGDAQYCYSRTGTTAGTDQVFAECFGFNSSISTALWTYDPPLCVNPATGGMIGESQSGCGTFTPVPLTSLALPGGETGTIEYKWQQSLTGPASGYLDIAGTNNPDYAPGPVTQTTWYRRLARVDCMPGWTGAAATEAVEITVDVPVIPFVTVIASQVEVCAGTIVYFDANAVNAGASPGYQWKVNGINVAGATGVSFSYVPNDGDVVACEVLSSEPCTTGNPATSPTVAIALLPLPVVQFTPCFDAVTAADAQPFRLRGGLPLNGTYNGPGVDPVTGFFDPALAGTGTMTIEYTVTNANQCSDVASATITVQPSQSFICGNPFTDIRDGKSYATVQIGTQCWMRVNLDYGVAIDPMDNQTDNCLAEKYILYSNIDNQYSTFYQWNELMAHDPSPGSHGLCPPSWHIPVAAEWETLVAYSSGPGKAGPILRDKLLENGFFSIQKGLLYLNSVWAFTTGTAAATMYWTSTESGTERAIARGINEINFGVSRYESARANAFAVRCVKN